MRRAGDKTWLKVKIAGRRLADALLRGHLPAELQRVDTMLLREELRILFDLGARHWDGRGLIVDGGCFLGGSTLALAHGIKVNPRWRANPVRPAIHSYDRFEIEPWTIGLYFHPPARGGDSFEARFRANIAPVADLIEVHRGDVTAHGWNGAPIEVLFIDLAKHWIVSDHVVRTFFPHLIAGHSIVVQQDYLYHEWNGWLAVTMELFRDYFRLERHARTGSVLFRLVTPIPSEKLALDPFQSLGRGAIARYMDDAIAHFTGPQKTMLMQSKRQLMDILVEHQWRP
jgi:hypothetical protein